MNKRFIYSAKINPYTVVEFWLYVKYKKAVVELPIDVIKDKIYFISLMLGTDKTYSNRTIYLWKNTAPFLDWDLINDLTVKNLGFVPDCINCAWDTYFVFDKYPDVQWIKQIEKTIKEVE